MTSGKRRTRREDWVLVTVFAAALLVGYPPLPRWGQDFANPNARAHERLAWMRQHQPGMWNVAPSEGAFLGDLVVKAKARRALEIGTSNGYSGIWIATRLRQVGIC